MGQLEKYQDKNGVEIGQSKIKNNLLMIGLYLILFIIVVTLFAQSFSWLLNGIDQFRLTHENYYMSEGQVISYKPPAQAQSSIVDYLAIPSIFTWLSGIIAAKIGDRLIDHCWSLIKYSAKKLWHRVKRY